MLNPPINLPPESLNKIAKELAPHIPQMIKSLKKLKQKGVKTTTQNGTPTTKRVL